MSPAAVPRTICRGELLPDRKPILSSFRKGGNPAVYVGRILTTTHPSTNRAEPSLGLPDVRLLGCIRVPVSLGDAKCSSTEQGSGSYQPRKIDVFGAVTGDPVAR